MKQKLTITIGIPVFNEEANIANLLTSILKQHQKNFSMEKIIVVLDGSTDKTASIVRTFINQYPTIHLVGDKRRKGKKNRLTELYKHNRSDIFITFDGDTVLDGNNVVDEMVKKFNGKSVGIVSPDCVPVMSKGFEAQVLFRLYTIWADARKKYNDGDNVYNIRGCAIAIKKDFAKKIAYRNDLVSEAQFLYFLAKQNKLKFRFSSEAKVVFRLPESFNEYFLQMSRTKNSRKKFAAFFGEWVYPLYKIPNTYKMRGVLVNFFSSPFYTLFAILFHIYKNYFRSRRYLLSKKNLWQVAKTTKGAIYV